MQEGGGEMDSPLLTRGFPAIFGVSQLHSIPMRACNSRKRIAGTGLPPCRRNPPNFRAGRRRRRLSARGVNWCGGNSGAMSKKGAVERALQSWLVKKIVCTMNTPLLHPQRPLCERVSAWIVGDKKSYPENRVVLEYCGNARFLPDAGGRGHNVAESLQYYLATRGLSGRFLMAPSAKFPLKP